MSPNSWIWKPCSVSGGRPEMFIFMVVEPPIGWETKTSNSAVKNQTL